MPTETVGIDFTVLFRRRNSNMHKRSLYRVMAEVLTDALRETLTLFDTLSQKYMRIEAVY